MSVKQSVRKREAEGENKVSGIEELILKLCCPNFCWHFLHESIGVGDKHCVQSLHGNTTAVNHSQCTVWSKPTLAAFISCAQRSAAESNQPAVCQLSQSKLWWTLYVPCLSTDNFWTYLASYLQACGGESSSDGHKRWNVWWLVHSWRWACQA